MEKYGKVKRLYRGSKGLYINFDGKRTYLGQNGFVFNQRGQSFKFEYAKDSDGDFGVQLYTY